EFTAPRADRQTSERIRVRSAPHRRIPYFPNLVGIFEVSHFKEFGEWTACEIGTQFVEVSNCAAKIIIAESLCSSGEFSRRHSKKSLEPGHLFSIPGNDLFVRKRKSAMSRKQLFELRTSPKRCLKIPLAFKRFKPYR